MSDNKPVDWKAIADRMVTAMHQMLHEENWHGPDSERYAEALRRALGYCGANEQRAGERALSYEHLKYGSGLTTDTEAAHVRDSHTISDRMAREAAEKQVKEMRAEVARVRREAAKGLAEWLRASCNERSVPSRYRREGVTWAADMIDPSVPKDRYGNLRPAAEQAEPAVTP